MMISLEKLGAIYCSVLFPHLFQVLSQISRVQERFPKHCKLTTPPLPTFLDVLFSIARVTMRYCTYVTCPPCLSMFCLPPLECKFHEEILFCFVFCCIQVPRIVPDTYVFRMNELINGLILLKRAFGSITKWRRNE